MVVSEWKAALLSLSQSRDAIRLWESCVRATRRNAARSRQRWGGPTDASVTIGIVSHENGTSVRL